MGDIAENWVPIVRVTNWLGADPGWLGALVSSGEVSSKTERGNVLIDPGTLGRWLHDLDDSPVIVPEDLKRLKAIGAAMAAGKTADAICQLVLEGTARSLGVTGAIVLVDDDGDLSPAASYGVSTASDAAVLQDLGGWTVGAAETLALGHPQSTGAEGGDLSWQRTCLATPLMTNGTPLGAVVLVRPPDAPFTDHEIALVEVIASQITLALRPAIIQASLDHCLAEADRTQRQMESYAHDLRGTFAAEKARAAQLARALAELKQTYLATVRGLAAAVEAKDAYTAGHIVRVTRYGLMMMELIAPNEAHDYQYEYGFLLHDVGKLAVPDAVLGKDGPLSDEEWKVMRLHPETGRRILDGIPFLGLAKEIVYAHHEWWDGKGYPLGLKGDAISLGARVFPVADSFDAMTSDRPYRKAMPTRDALTEIRIGSGSQFWPKAAEAFLSIPVERLEEVRQGATRWDPLRRD